MSSTTGKATSDFRALIDGDGPVVVPGIYNAISAKIAESVGFGAAYMSGAATANGMYGIPDIGVVTRTEFVENARKITASIDIPLICDADAGFGNALGVERTVQEFERAGVAGIHIEDQREPKRCGHVAGKEVVPVEEMEQKIRAGVEARQDPDFFIIARVDALAVEGYDAAVDRAGRYIEAGADAIFAEALTSPDEFRSFARDVSGAPLLANMTEFGTTPYLSAEEFHSMGWKIVLFPMASFRSTLYAVKSVLSEIYYNGTQEGMLDTMMHRSELYELLDYDGVVARDAHYESSASDSVLTSKE